MVTAMNDIGFLGLGNLGTPIAANLIASGHALTVWNRTSDKTGPLVAKGAKAAATPVGAITKGGVVFSILWDDASLDQLVTPEFLDALGPGGVHVSMTTVTPECARRVAARHEKAGNTYVESPIFGVPPAAVAKQLTFCIAGPKAAKERVRPLLEAAGGLKIFDFGESIGAGTATKLAGNYMIIAGFSVIQECFEVLKKAGVDPKPTLEMLTSTVAATPGNQRYAGYLLSGNRPTSGIPLKDIGLFEQFARDASTQSPLASAVLAAIKRELS
jgi:3-hydroxyisobutyrate dehydrogenase-like beta-hydroxyacid dehydrogenase